MADGEQNQQALDEDSMVDGPNGEVQHVVMDAEGLVSTGEVVDGTQVNVVGGVTVTEDILQQALEEAAAGGFENATVEYTTDGMDGEEQQFVTVSDGLTVDDLGDGNTYTIINNADGQEVLPYTINEDGNLARLVNITDGTQVSFGSQHIHEVVELPQQVSLPVQLEIPPDTELVDPESAEPGTSVLSVDSEAPLGSSDNPIRIVQQGNQYTSVQQLTPEQLTHIMQVLQQQQVAKATQEAGSSTLYNPQTNTKIVYRVIYPSDLHKSSGAVVTSIESESLTNNKNSVQGLIRGRGRGRPRKNPPPPPPEEEDDKYDAPELTKLEKEERKKHRPRTRSGRVSKPPKHMVKDYKHIHLLDWEEDYDDSDGGYSDYKGSGEEDNADVESLEGNDPESMLAATRPRKHKCVTCGKAYIGKGGLGRHYKLYPDHGALEEDPLPSVPDELIAAEEDTTSITNGIGIDASPSSSTTSTTIQTVVLPEPVPVPQPTPVPPPQPEPVSTPAPVMPVKRRPGRPPKSAGTTTSQKTPNWTPRPKPNVYIEKPSKRKVSLKEFIKQCEDEELMEVVLPRLVKAITLWEFLMMKSEKGRPLKPHIPDIIREFEVLQKQVNKICQEFLKPSTLEPDPSTIEDNPHKVHISNEAIASSLNLDVGYYDVMDVPVGENTPFQYKFLTTDMSNMPLGNVPEKKRTIQIVTPDELVQSPRKKIRLHAVNNDIPDLQKVSQLASAAGITNFKIVDTQSGHVVPSSPIIVNRNAALQIIRAQSESTQEIKEGVTLQIPEQVPSSPVKPVIMHLAESPKTKVLTSVEEKATATTTLSEIPQTSAMDSASVEAQTGDTSVKEEYATPKVEISNTNKSEPESTSMDTTEVAIVTAPSATSSSNLTLATTVRTDSVGITSEIPVTCTNTSESDMTATTSVITNGANDSVGNMNGSVVVAVDAEGVQVPAAEGETDGVSLQDQAAVDVSQIQIYQTQDGTLLIQKPDGTVLQIQHTAGEPIPLETVQALLAMDGQGMIEQVDQAEVVEQ